MPSDIEALRNQIENLSEGRIRPTSEFMGHLLDRIAVHLREAENTSVQRSEHHRNMAETYATVYRAVRL